MFQYAAARAVSLRAGADLVLDNWSGFVRDTQYRRHFELGSFSTGARIARPLERLPIWLYRVQNKVFRQRSVAALSRTYGRFFVEDETSYMPEIDQVKIEDSLWLVGYWQSPKYFSDCAGQLLLELNPSQPNSVAFIRLGERMRQEESVAIGVRLYEESTNPEAHARNGKIKTVADVRSAIERVILRYPSARLYVFCTHKASFFDQLELPEGSVFVTHDDGYRGSIDRLWLISQCRHHILTNSSYYWWGAWLSENTYPGNVANRAIIAADNFINRDALCEHWETF